MTFENVGYMQEGVQFTVMTTYAFRDVRYTAVNTVFISNQSAPGAKIVWM
jgi:hypothetical protein